MMQELIYLTYSAAAFFFGLTLLEVYKQKSNSRTNKSPEAFLVNTEVEIPKFQRRGRIVKVIKGDKGVVYSVNCGGTKYMCPETEIRIPKLGANS